MEHKHIFQFVVSLMFFKKVSYIVCSAEISTSLNVCSMSFLIKKLISYKNSNISFQKKFKNFIVKNKKKKHATAKYLTKKCNKSFHTECNKKCMLYRLWFMFYLYIFSLIMPDNKMFSYSTSLLHKWPKQYKEFTFWQVLYH